MSLSAKRIGQLELNLVAHFPKPQSWTAARERTLIEAQKWFPHTLDFRAVAGSQSIEISSAWDFLLKVLQVRSIIRRLNFFSHGKTGLIAMEGTVYDDGSNVELGSSEDGRWTHVIRARKGPIMDPYASKWGTFGEDSNVGVVIGKTRLNLEDVRSKFATDAVIWLYLCHGGGDPYLFQEVANTFQVKVKGWRYELLFCPPNNFPTSRNHKLAVLTTSSREALCSTAVGDFHGLDNPTDGYAKAITALPERPGMEQQQSRPSIWTQVRNLGRP